MRDRNSQFAILEGLSINEAKSQGKYYTIGDIKTNSKVRDFFVHRGLVEDFYNFMIEWDRARKEHYTKDLPNLEFKELRYSVGKNYIKIVTDHSVAAFVDRFGNVYKAASWEAPAKGVRYYLDEYKNIKFDAYSGFLYGNRNLTPRDEEFYGV